MKDSLRLEKQTERTKKIVQRLRREYSTEFTAGQEHNLIKLALQRQKGRGWGMSRNLFGSLIK